MSKQSNLLTFFNDVNTSDYVKSKFKFITENANYKAITDTDEIEEKTEIEKLKEKLQLCEEKFTLAEKKLKNASLALKKAASVLKIVQSLYRNDLKSLLTKSATGRSRSNIEEKSTLTPEKKKMIEDMLRERIINEGDVNIQKRLKKLNILLNNAIQNVARNEKRKSTSEHGATVTSTSIPQTLSTHTIPASPGPSTFPYQSQTMSTCTSPSNHVPTFPHQLQTTSTYTIPASPGPSTFPYQPQTMSTHTSLSNTAPIFLHQPQTTSYTTPPNHVQMFLHQPPTPSKYSTPPNYVTSFPCHQSIYADVAQRT